MGDVISFQVVANLSNISGLLLSTLDQDIPLASLPDEAMISALIPFHLGDITVAFVSRYTTC